jgi:hypothetical protein
VDFRAGAWERLECLILVMREGEAGDKAEIRH